MCLILINSILFIYNILGNNNLGQNAPSAPPNTESSSKSPAEQSNTPAPPPPQPQPPSPPTGGGKPTSNEKIENEYQF
jgi:hypothetical protein